MTVAPDAYCFGRWQLHPQRRLLYADGNLVPLNGRAFDILVLLVARHGEVVSRDEIVAHVWTGLVVGENNLTVQMSNLRRVLGDDADGAPLIVTVPGRGYRFTCIVLNDDVPTPISPGATAIMGKSLNPLSTRPMSFWGFINLRRIRTAVVFSVCATFLCVGGIAYMAHPPVLSAPRLSIAVLPFHNLAPDHTQDYLADALTDDLTTDLAHIPASTVIARESADMWRAKAATVQQIAQSLHVRYVVEGSILREENQYHVNAQLVDAESGAHLWTARFEAPEGHIGEVRDVIVRRLATALDFRLTQVEGSRSLRDRPDDPDALDLFFRARALLNASDSLASLTQAQLLLDRAVRKQPDFADALADLGTLLLQKANDTDDPDRPADLAEAHIMITRALTLSPNHAKAMAAESHRLAITGDCTSANYTAHATLIIEPSNLGAEAVLADCARKLGHLEEAVLHLKTLLRLSPDGPKTHNRFLTLGFIDMLQGNSGQAIDELRRAIAGSISEASLESMNRNEVARLLLIAATQMQGDVVTASDLYTKYRNTSLNRTVWRFGAMFSKADSHYPGTKALLNALVQAGMPRFADEHSVSQNVLSSCLGGEFDDTPAKLAGARLLDTQAVIAELRVKPGSLLLDLGDGVATPPGAILYDYTSGREQPNEFVRRVAKEHFSHSHEEPVIIMGAGIYGCASFNAAEILVRDGYTHVGWYRGGEEAWAGAGQEAEDRRPI